MRHVSRTHRVKSDWLFDRVNLDSNISVNIFSHRPTDRRYSYEGSFTCDKWNELMILVGIVLRVVSRTPFSVVATLVPLAQQMTKRTHPFTDEASKYTVARSKSKQEGKRVLGPAAVRHEKSSPLIPAQEKTQSDVKGQENPSQESGDRLHFPGSSRLKHTHNQKRQIGKVTCQKENRRMHLDVTSPITPMSRHRETDCSQQKMRTNNFQTKV